METKFEFVGPRTEAMIKDFAFASVFKNKIFFIIRIVLLAIFACNVFLHFVTWDKPLLTLMNASFVLLLLYIFEFSMYRSVYKLTLKRQNEISRNEEIIFTIEFFDEMLKHRSSLGETRIDFSYSDVKYIVKSKNNYFIFTKAKQAFLLNKDQVSKGEIEEFEPFIKAKIKEAKNKAK